MIRIGILGAESSHALAFARWFNLPDPATGAARYENIRVTAVLDDCPQAALLAEVTGAALVTDPICLAAQVDAAMITARRGSEHLALARPLAQKRMPLFIDKPFAAGPAQAMELARLLTDQGCPVQGGSGCQFSPGVQALKAEAHELAEGRLLGGSACFGIDLDSPYDGFYFYAPHLVEPALEIFGDGVRQVSALRQGRNLTAMLHYGSFSVSLHFLYASQAAAGTVYTDTGVIHRIFDISQILEEEASRFAGLLLGTQTGLTSAELVRPVQIIDAILRSDAAGGAAVQVDQSACLP